MPDLNGLLVTWAGPIFAGVCGVVCFVVWLFSRPTPEQKVLRRIGAELGWREREYWRAVEQLALLKQAGHDTKADHQRVKDLKAYWSETKTEYRDAYRVAYPNEKT